MAVSIGPKIGIEGEAEYRKALQNIIQQQKTLKAEMQETASAFDKNASAQEKMKAKAEALNKQIEVQKQRVSELSHMVEESTNKYGEADTRTLKWKQALAEAETELNNLNSELKSTNGWTAFGEAATAAGEKIEAVSGKIKSVGDSITRSITAPIAAVATAGAKYVSDFDTSMSKVRALAGDASEEVSAAVVAMAQETGKQFEITGDATADAYAALEVVARQNAEVTKYTAAESAEAMSYMALAGWDVQQMADGLPGILNLAAASQMDLSRASDIVTDQLTAFGLGAEQAAHFADVLAITQAKSNTTTDAMGEALKYVGPVAGALGYNIEDVSIALGLMANSGIKASTAGTTLRTILQNMANPTDTMAAAMERLGVKLDDGEGNMLDLKSLLDNLREGFGGLKMPMETFQQNVEFLDSALEQGSISEEKYNEEMSQLIEDAFTAEGALKAQTAAQLAGTRGMSGLLAIVNAAPDDYEALTKAIYGADGAAEEMANVMIDNLSGKLEILKSKLGETAFQFLDGLMPSIESAVESIQSLVDRFNSLNEKQKKTILTIAGVAAAIGPVLSMIGRVGTGVGTIIKVVGKVSTVIGSAGGLTGVLGGLGTAFASVGTFITGTAIPAIGAVLAAIAPALPIILGVAAAVAAVVLVVKNWGAITEWLGGVWDKVMTVLSNAWAETKASLEEGWENLKTSTKETWNNVKDTISGAWDNAVSTVKGAIDTVKTGVVNGWNNIKTNTTNAWNNIKSRISTAWSGIKSNVSTAANNAKTSVVNAWNNLKSNTSTAWGNIKSTIQTNGGGIKGVITTAVQGYQSIWKSAFSAINSVTGGKMGSIYNTISSIMSSVKNVIYDKIWGAWSTVKSAISSISSLFSNARFSFPHISLPHFSWSWKDIGGIVKIPQISVSWYKKAYQNPVMFTSPTVLGTSSGMKGFGDGRGGEIVIGKSMMFSMIRDAVAAGGNTTYGNIYVTVNGAEGQNVNELADIVVNKINHQVMRRRAAGMA